ncbi:Atu4866 domain-containing protein [Microbacterium marinilacus]|uniref:Amidohydrolase n=1 Tax=Microbacterium marinilacus TaxID=415209 RepID=A0ABP7BXM2_9MICO|nr:Atu4866 domain-containing protein [Microbacterium marinilacus]MBY0688030.1 Atu4866 domain-containing protein [Microbacterium marinilacus]
MTEPASGLQDHPGARPDMSSVRLFDGRLHIDPVRAIRGALQIEDGVISYVGPERAGGETSAPPRVDLRGASVVPLQVRGAVGARRDSDPEAYDLVPGNPATFAIVSRRVSAAEVRGTLMIRPADLVAIVVAGELVAWEGEPVAGVTVDVAADWEGAWEDPSHALEQHLLPGGRYSETRSGRTDAYTGRYWTRGDCIVYLDDSGFWAFGVQHRGTLFHADFVMRRA